MNLASFSRTGALAMLLVPAVAWAQPAPPNDAGAKPAASPPAAKGSGELKSFEDKLSYAVGLNAGRVMQQQGLNPDPDLFMRGFKDSFKEGDPLLSDEEIQEVFAQVQQQMQEKQQANAKKLQTNWDETFGEKNKPQGAAKTAKSGLKYEVFAEGKGPKPKATDTVVVHYVGELPDGKVFDSSVARGEPAVFPVGGVIKGWTEGLQLMSVGSKYKFYIPSDLAYGKEGRPPRIPSNQDLVFEVELLDILPADGVPAEE